MKRMNDTFKKLRQIQLSSLGALVALGGTKYLLDYGIEQECFPALIGACASVLMLVLFTWHMRDIARSL